MLENFTFARLGWAFATICAVLILRFAQRLHQQRRLFRHLHGPPHSYLWGHLRAFGDVVAKQPKRAAPQLLPLIVQQEYRLQDYVSSIASETTSTPHILLLMEDPVS